MKLLRALSTCILEIPEDGHSTTSLSQGCSTPTVNNAFLLLKNNFPGLQLEIIASCPFTVQLQEKLGCILICNPLFSSVSLQPDPPLAFCPPGQTNPLPSAAPHTGRAPPDPYRGLLLDPLQFADVLSMWRGSVAKTEHSIYGRCCFATARQRGITTSLHLLATHQLLPTPD